MVIYRDTQTLINKKMIHVRCGKSKLYTGFCVDNGDIPVARINHITGKCEDVVNPRGNAYATRNQNRFYKKV